MLQLGKSPVGSSLVEHSWLDLLPFQINRIQRKCPNIWQLYRKAHKRLSLWHTQFVCQQIRCYLFEKPLKLIACPPLLDSRETGVNRVGCAPGQVIWGSLRRTGAQRGLKQQKVLQPLRMLASPGESAKWLRIADILFIFLLFPSPPMFKKFLETRLYRRLRLSNPLLSSRAVQVT